jgi:hypothetical protein
MDVAAQVDIMEAIMASTRIPPQVVAATQATIPPVEQAHVATTRHLALRGRPLQCPTLAAEQDMPRPRLHQLPRRARQVRRVHSLETALDNLCVDVRRSMGAVDASSIFGLAPTEYFNEDHLLGLRKVRSGGRPTEGP